MGAQVGQPGRELERRVRERLGALGGQSRLEGLRVVAPAAGVTHHHLEEHRTLGPGDDGAERGAQGKLDVGPDRARAVSDGDLALEHEDDVGREGQPLLADMGRRAVGIGLSLDSLPGDVGVVYVAEGGLEPST